MDGERKIERIKYSSKFLKQASKLPKRVIEQANHKETLFKSSPFHPLLRTHKLHGKDKELWVFWIDNSYRIKFIFLPNREVLFLAIGTHEIYK